MVRAILLLLVVSVFCLFVGISMLNVENTPQQIVLLQRTFPDFVLDMEGKTMLLIPEEKRAYDHIMVHVDAKQPYSMDVYRVMHEGQRYWLRQHDYLGKYKEKAGEDIGWLLILGILSLLYIAVALNIHTSGNGPWIFGVLALEAAILVSMDYTGQIARSGLHPLWSSMLWVGVSAKVVAVITGIVYLWRKPVVVRLKDEARATAIARMPPSPEYLERQRYQKLRRRLWLEKKKSHRRREIVTQNKAEKRGRRRRP